MKNNVIIIVDANGSLLSEPIGQLRANANYTAGITVLAPFDLTTVVSANFKKNNRREKDEANYLIPTSYKGKDIITDVNHPLYQKVYNYNVWENILTDDATAYIATFTADMLYASIGFGIKQTPALATTYLGEFGIGIPLPLSANNGDYLISNSYNYYQGGINYTFGDYAYWYNDKWNKSNYIGIAGTDSFPVGVSPNIKANYEITENVDLSVLLAGRVAVLEQEVDVLQNDLIDLEVRISGNESEIERLDDEKANNIDITNLDNKKFDKVPVDNIPFLNALGKIDARYLDVGDSFELFIIVNELPPVELAQENKIYLVPSGGSGDNIFTEYFVWEGEWETLGSVGINLNDFYSKIQIDGMLTSYVLKETGKGLSTNDFTNVLKTKLDGIETGAEVNVQSDWNITDTANDAFIKNKPEIKTVATTGNYNDLINKPDLTLKLDKNFAALPSQASPLLTDVLVINRGTAAQKVTLGNLLAQIDDEIFIVEATLPTTGVVNKIYLVASSEPTTQNALDEFIWVDNAWEKIGSVSVDLSDYFNKTEINSMINDKVDKNANITAGTSSKITYDAKGLVTGGADLVAADIPPLPASKITQTTTARFVTDAEKSTWNGKQDKLVAGNNITINQDNVISASGGGTVEWNDIQNKPELYDKSEVYNKYEIGMVFEDAETTIDNKDANTLQAAKDYTYSKVEIDNKDTAIMNKANNLENANMFKDVNYNNVNGVLTFTKYDNTTKEIDLPLELLVESGYYDEVENELVLVLANSSEIRIPVGNLLTDLDAHNIRFNGSGTNYLTNKKEVESAVKELDTRVKANADNKVDKVTGKGLSTNDFTTTEKNKLSGIQAGAQVNAVTTVAGRTGAVVLAKADVGLGSVQNYAIASKTQAEAGTANDLYMTPLRTKELITVVMGDIESALDAILGV